MPGPGEVNQASAVTGSMLSNSIFNYSCSWAQRIHQKLLRHSSSLLLKEAMKSSSHRWGFGIRSITSDDEEATAVKREKKKKVNGDLWREMETNASPVLPPSHHPPPPPSATSMHKPRSSHGHASLTPHGIRPRWHSGPPAAARETYSGWRPTG